MCVAGPSCARHDATVQQGSGLAHLSYLLTHFGTFVCYDHALHSLVHVAWDAVTEMTSLADVTLLRGVDRSVTTARLEVAATDHLLGPGPALRQDLAVTPVGAGDGRIVALSDDRRYLCAELNRIVTMSRDTANAWERFFVIEPEEVQDLFFLLRNRWVLHRTGAVIGPADIVVEPGFCLRFGLLALTLAEILPLRHARRFAAPDQAAFFRTDLFVDAWKVERVSLYRPLLFYAAFGDEALFQQLALSLLSLVEFAGYEDAVLVYTDRDAAGLAPYIPPRLLGKVQVVTMRAPEVLHFKLARYQITRSRLAATCQPLLYADVDIVFDMPLQPILAALAGADTLHAAAETGLAAEIQSLGAELLQADGVATGTRRGFNSGTIGCPNLTVAGGQLRLIEDALSRYARHIGGNTVWQDQPMNNYVAVKTDGVQTTLLSDRMRFDHPLLVGEAGLQPVDRRGMVHFWSGKSQQAKQEAMAIYVQALRTMLAAG